MLFSTKTNVSCVTFRITAHMFCTFDFDIDKSSFIDFLLEGDMYRNEGLLKRETFLKVLSQKARIKQTQNIDQIKVFVVGRGAQKLNKFVSMWNPHRRGRNSCHAFMLPHNAMFEPWCFPVVDQNSCSCLRHEGA